MVTIVAGSRGLGKEALSKALEACPWTSKITSVVSGTARGIDLAGEEWALNNGRAVRRFPAAWSTEGKGAGFKRNIKMARVADALLAVWDGKSRGTKHMIDIATQRGLTVFVFKVTS